MEENKKIAKKILDEKMKPIGSLGVLEDIGIKLVGIYGYPLEKIEKKLHLLISSDNGVANENISSCPIKYTKLVTQSILNNYGAISLMCNTLGVELEVLDIGIIENIKEKYNNLIVDKISNGSKNFYIEPAMSIDECKKAINIGIEYIKKKSELYENIIFSNGEMGIGNTTTSSAILYSLIGGNIDDIVGRGSGIDDITLKNKKRVIEESCKRYNTFEMTPLEILSTVGGYDIACMVGLYLGAVKYKKLILVDGFISATAVYLAYKINPKVKEYILFTHLSEEVGMKQILREMGEKTFLNMSMRMGEGTGAVLTYPVIDCAISLMNGMKTPLEIEKIFE